MQNYSDFALHENQQDICKTNSLFLESVSYITSAYFLQDALGFIQAAFHEFPCKISENPRKVEEQRFSKDAFKKHCLSALENWVALQVKPPD